MKSLYVLELPVVDERESAKAVHDANLSARQKEDARNRERKSGNQKWEKNYEVSDMLRLTRASCEKPTSQIN
ncbi:hypothetical protein FOZ61_007552 [Perkinsus olseni]|uniref:Uncharacterized protein n=1 Tax=Perkinsus olseni TaxID=32597 RepID=A0A7J6L8I1_PEROL|nr:hypothetical protein FOZ61_007552 [Perkinsus olseni]